MKFKRIAWILCLSSALSAGWARAEIVLLSDETQSAPANRPEFDGLITKVNIPKSFIGVVDQSNGKYRRITLKKGMIGGYRIGDYVHVTLRNNMNEAKEIRKIAPPPRP